MQQIFTFLSRASLVHNVLHIFLTEIPECGDDRVGSCLSKSAQAGNLHMRCQLFDLVEFFHCGSALCDIVEHMEQTLCSDSAGRTFTAGLLAGELKSMMISPPDPIMEPIL